MIFCKFHKTLKYVIDSITILYCFISFKIWFCILRKTIFCTIFFNACLFSLNFYRKKII